MKTRIRRTSGRARGARPGFTLVELLVVVSIIALLISILLPSLKKARDSAKAVVCGSTLRGFGTGMMSYTTEEQDWIPGVNTSGAEVQLKSPNDISLFQPGRMPVQSFDWITPLLRTTTSLPSVRAQRFRLLLEEYRCASVNFKAVVFKGARPKPGDNSDFLAEEGQGKFFAVSYLMPAYFQLWGPEVKESLGMGPVYFAISAKTVPTTWTVDSKRFKSRVDRVGTPAEKVAAADGTRYLTDVGLLDFDHSIIPNTFGAFTDGGPFRRESAAYGDTGIPRRTNDGGQIPLSYRHSGSMEALFFDGHVEKLSQKQSHKIDYWYPRGSVLKDNDPAQVFTDFATYQVGYVIR